MAIKRFSSEKETGVFGIMLLVFLVAFVFALTGLGPVPTCTTQVQYNNAIFDSAFRLIAGGVPAAILGGWLYRHRPKS